MSDQSFEPVPWPDAEAVEDARLWIRDVDSWRVTAVEQRDPERRRISIIEAVAAWGGEAPTLEPACASPILTVLVGMWSEGLGRHHDLHRQSLKRVVPALSTSFAPDQERERGWRIASWFVRTCLPTMLDATEHDDLVRSADWLRSYELLHLATEPVVALLEELDTQLGDLHRRLRPNAYLSSAGSLTKVESWCGSIAAWNALVRPVTCSHSLESTEKDDDGEALSHLGSITHRLIHFAVKIAAQPAMAREFASRSSLPPVPVPGRPMGQGFRFAEALAIARETVGPFARRAGFAALEPSVVALISTIHDLLDDLLDVQHGGSAR